MLIYILLIILSTIIFISHIYVKDEKVWGIERSVFFNGREKWAKDFENQRV